MPETFEANQNQFQRDEAALLAELSPEQQRRLAAIRANDAQALQAQRAAADEAIAQRVAAILAARMPIPRSTPVAGGRAHVVRHPKLICDQSSDVLSADHPDPHGEMRKRGVRNATFSGFGTFHEEADLTRDNIAAQAFYLPDEHGEYPAKAA